MCVILCDLFLICVLLFVSVLEGKEDSHLPVMVKLQAFCTEINVLIPSLATVSPEPIALRLTKNRTWICCKRLEDHEWFCDLGSSMGNERTTHI